MTRTMTTSTIANMVNTFSDDVVRGLVGQPLTVGDPRSGDLLPAVVCGARRDRTRIHLDLSVEHDDTPEHLAALHRVKYAALAYRLRFDGTVQPSYLLPEAPLGRERAVGVVERVVNALLGAAIGSGTGAYAAWHRLGR